tara:strand:+ start:93 stop:521 length:429 start_codon:yes stop_codon:yes gene_type:complete
MRLTNIQRVSGPIGKNGKKSTQKSFPPRKGGPNILIEWHGVGHIIQSLLHHLLLDLRAGEHHIQLQVVKKAAVIEVAGTDANPIINDKNFSMKKSPLIFVDFDSRFGQAKKVGIGNPFGDPNIIVKGDHDANVQTVSVFFHQ